MLKITYDREGDIMEFRFSDSRIKDSEYIEESGIVIDYDEHNMIVAIEILSFSKRIRKEKFKEAIVL